MTTHFINGEWIPGEGDAFTSTNPANDGVIWEGRAASHQNVNRAVDAAKAAFPAWSALSLEERIEHLHHYREELKKIKPELAKTISEEMGKPIWEANGEVEAMRNKIDISIDAYKNRTPSAGNEIQPAATRHKPHGVIAVFGPFNFPGHLPNGHIIPALLAGNTIVFKPSEQTPKTGELMVKCWNRLPKGVLNLVQGARDTGRFLAHNPRIDGLFFTGSWQTGKLFQEYFASKPGKILALELGGNNPLVFSSCDDLQAAAYLVIQSAFLTSGQRCTCARRLIIPPDSEELLKAIVAMAQKIKIGSSEDSFMGPLATANSANNLMKAQENLMAKGGVSLLEMKQNGAFITPGIIDVTDVRELPDEEYFGPLLQVIRVSSFDEAIKKANATSYGLSAGLISNDKKEYDRFREEVNAGIINWNTPLTGASSAAPFGGVGKSGNFRPSAYYAADYCAYPVASMEKENVSLPENLSPGIDL